MDLSESKVSTHTLTLKTLVKVMQTEPLPSSGSNVKLWSIKQDEHIRINLVEFYGAIPRHLHPDADHSLMILEGEVMAEVNGNHFQLTKGDFISIPKNVPHSYESITKKSLFVSMDAPYYDPKKTIYMP